MSKTLFFDTYALIELSKGNPNYHRYKENTRILLNKLNLLEYSYYLLRVGKAEKIGMVFNELNDFTVEYDDEILVKATKMKFEYKKEKLSFIDCIGYFLAKKHGVRFLTGDEKFKDKSNVEFVK